MPGHPGSVDDSRRVLIDRLDRIAENNAAAPGTQPVAETKRESRELSQTEFKKLRKQAKAAARDERKRLIKESKKLGKFR